MTTEYTTMFTFADYAGQNSDHIVERLLQGFYIGIMTVLAVGGNGLIIFIGVANHSILSNVSTLLIFVLCMSHFLQGIGNMLWITLSLITGSWLGGSDGIWCKLSAGFPNYMVHISYLLLALISIECCYAISRPFKYRIYMSFKNVSLGVACCLLLPIPVNTVIFFEMDVHFNGYQGQCSQLWDPTNQSHKIYMLMMFIPFAIIPMLVMVLSYFLIFNAVSARQSVVCPTYTNNNQLKAELRKEFNVSWKIAKMALIMISCFVITWLPNCILSLAFMFKPEAIEVIPMWLIDVSGWLYYVSPAIDPVIYTLRNQSLRYSIKRLITEPCRNIMHLSKNVCNSSVSEPTRLTSYRPSIRPTVAGNPTSRVNSLNDNLLFRPRIDLHKLHSNNENIEDRRFSVPRNFYNSNQATFKATAVL
ncbi:hypothetical protein ACHWQZ_G007438 [Mnemiopsis leidyi]